MPLEIYIYNGPEGGIVSEGIAQVIEDLGNPLAIVMQCAVADLSQFVSTCRSSTGFAALPNSVLTPELGPQRLTVFDEGVGGWGLKIGWFCIGSRCPHKLVLVLNQSDRINMLASATQGTYRFQTVRTESRNWVLLDANPGIH